MPTRALVFEFESEVDRDQAVDVITPILKEAQRKGKAPVADTQQPPSGLQGPQAALKQKLLQEDRCELSTDHITTGVQEYVFTLRHARDPG